jgi:HEAT repeat protein
MSLALIQESAKEVRRLAIAGSPLAVGDFRLKKLIGPLDQAGAKAPVFAQVAKAISDLVNGKEGESAANLLNLSTLLNAILYTQGQSSAEGSYRELETFASNCSSTRTAARVLKPLVQALTTFGAGRLELVKSAVERGAFNDLRLIDPAIYALGDTFPELADLVAEKVLPGFGPGIVPRLKATLDLKGKKHDARKLMVMHQLDPAGAIELCKTALEEGSPDVKAAAIGCLGKHEECLPLVLEQANSKNKQLRAAALEALAAHDRPEITTLFTRLVKGKALDILTGPFRALRNRQVLNSLLDEGRDAFALSLKSDEGQILRFAEILECLKERKDAEVEEFLIGCFNQSDKLGKIRPPKKSALIAQTTAADLADRMAGMLYENGSTRALEAVVAQRDVLPVEAFNHVLHGALRIWAPDRIYQEFSGLLKQDKGAGKLKREALQHAIRTTCGGYVFDPEEAYEDSNSSAAQQQPKWDPRWLDAAIAADDQMLVCCLATPGHKAALNYLVKALEKKGQSETGLIIRALARCQHPNVTKQFLDAVAKKTKGGRHVDYDLQLLFKSARHLPPADLPRLDEFAATLDEKLVDHFLEAIAPLRSVTPAA